MAENKLALWTVGHSTRSIEEFLETLLSFQIKVLVDVRSFPGSRRYPHFNKEQLRISLAAKQIEYHHFPELGGRRRVQPDSLNMVWRNKSFRAYADYMETEGFVEGIARLLQVARQQRLVHHVQHQQRRHSVVGEALPGFGERQKEKPLGMPQEGALIARRQDGFGCTHGNRSSLAHR